MFLKIFFIKYCQNYEEIIIQNSNKENTDKFYKKKLKELLPWQRTSLLIIFIIFIINVILVAFFKNILYYYIGLLIDYVVFIICIAYFFSIKNQIEMLPTYEKEYQQRKEVVLKTLKAYSIDYKDETKINFLIEKLKEKRNKNIQIEILKKIFSSSIPLSILYIFKENVMNILKVKSLLFLFFTYLITVFCILVLKIIYDITFGIYINKYKKYYDYLIEDLNELNLFSENID